MKKIYIVVLLTLMPVLAYSQFFGFGGQYSEKSDGQFFVSISRPTIYPINPLNSFMSSGLEYTTSGGAQLSGLHLKPVQLTTFFSEDFFNNTPFTILLGVDGGYLFDFRHNRKNALVVTPNLYVDYKFFFVKGGYDVDLSHGNDQFFIRAGVSLGLGTFKILDNVKIW